TGHRLHHHRARCCNPDGNTLAARACGEAAEGPHDPHKTKSGSVGGRVDASAWTAASSVGRTNRQTPRLPLRLARRRAKSGCPEQADYPVVPCRGYSAVHEPYVPPHACRPMAKERNANRDDQLDAWPPRSKNDAALCGGDADDASARV